MARFSNLARQTAVADPAVGKLAVPGPLFYILHNALINLLKPFVHSRVRECVCSGLCTTQR